MSIQRFCPPVIEFGQEPLTSSNAGELPEPPLCSSPSISLTRLPTEDARYEKSSVLQYSETIRSQLSESTCGSFGPGIARKALEKQRWRRRAAANIIPHDLSTVSQSFTALSPDVHSLQGKALLHLNCWTGQKKPGAKLCPKLS